MGFCPYLCVGKNCGKVKDNGWGRYHHHAVTNTHRKIRHYDGYECGWDICGKCVEYYYGECDDSSTDDTDDTDVYQYELNDFDDFKPIDEDNSTFLTVVKYIICYQLLFFLFRTFYDSN